MVAANPQSNKTAVLIVGAGPTGLVMALWLRRRNVAFRIIDKSRAAGETSRALGIQARTLEFYRQLGIDKEIIASSVLAREVVIRRHGLFAARANLGAMGENITAFPHLTFLSQDLHEDILNKRLTELGVQVERQTELLQLTQDISGVTAKLRGPNGEETLRSAYLCGCDGAHSRVRQELGIEFPGGTYNQVFFVADVQASGEMAQAGVQVSVSRAGFCIVMPIEKRNSIRLTGIVPPEKAHQEHIQFTDVQDAVEKDTRLKIDAVNWFSIYRVHHRVAASFCKGRVFLCGDAGHIHSPVGAQGMNTGIGDAVNLAWKLAEVMQKRATPRMLDTYEPERLAFARRLIKTTDTAFRLIANQSLLGSLWRTHILPRLFAFITSTKTGLRFMFRTISQVGIHYRFSILSQSAAAGTLQAGDRLPWVRTADGDNHECLNSLDWQLHVYGDLQPALRSTADAMKMSLKQFTWNNDMAAKGFLKDAYYLVRPDGYIALVQWQQDSASLQDYLRRWR